MSGYYSFSLASILAVVMAAPAMAQAADAAAQTVAASQNVISYTPADFAAARPNTAMDMINRLPGFQFDGGDSVRGFAGAAGNVLIDGQRPTIKSDSLQDTLARITIKQVERIDVIRGSVPESRSCILCVRVQSWLTARTSATGLASANRSSGQPCSIIDSTSEVVPTFRNVAHSLRLASPTITWKRR